MPKFSKATQHGLGQNYDGSHNLNQCLFIRSCHWKDFHSTLITYTACVNLATHVTNSTPAIHINHATYGTYAN